MKILIEIKNEYIIFSIYKGQIDKVNLNNTNVIDTKKLLFTDDYIRKNKDLLSSFLNIIVNNNKVSRVLINEVDLMLLTLDIIENIKAIKQVYVKENKTLSYDVCSKLQENKNIEYVSCYNMPCYMFDTLDILKRIKINLRCEMLFVSNFMESNNMHTYSDIYYKRDININYDINNDLLDDIKAFFRLNNNLENINIYYFSKVIIDEIINLINEKRLSYININVYQNGFNNKEILKASKYLKEKNYLLKRNNNKINIVYSNKFKQEKLLKQINLNLLRTSALVGFSFVFIISGFYFLNINNTKLELNNISNLLSNLTTSVNKTSLNSFNQSSKDESVELTDDFNKLQEINKETIGFLTVNNTNIKYPFVQHYNNNYYTNHDFYNKENINGWIFMDYRNNNELSSQNTIIYGHNSEVIFGSLKNVLEKSWYTNEDNQIITISTPKETLKYQIFSIYTIPDTNDYLVTNFSSDDSYEYFINMIKNRSIYDFNTNVTTDNKIITLSTCYKNNKNKLVVHAKLLK